MKITTTKNGRETVIAIEGKLDTVTAPDLDKELQTQLEGTEKLTMDFSELSYVSSAGLRVILKAQKAMNKQGELIITGVQETVKDVLDITGFTDILNIR